MTTSQAVASALLDIGAVGFSLDTPITFKSGMLSPVYVDNRRLPFHPTQWRVILDGFAQLIQEKQIEFDTIAGVESAGIPHSAALGYLMQKPSIFVRKKVKDHGTKSRVEGGPVEGSTVLLLEDLVTTGSSSLAVVEALREAQAIVRDCLVIVNYDFPESRAGFAAAKVRLHPLTTFEDILNEGIKRKKITAVQRKSVTDWLADPWAWKG